MKKEVKKQDLICSNCGYVYPIKVGRHIDKIKGFKYCYCFKCQKITRHQSVEDYDLYLEELKRKEEDELTKKDKILKKALNMK